MPRSSSRGRKARAKARNPGKQPAATPVQPPPANNSFAALDNTNEDEEEPASEEEFAEDGAEERLAEHGGEMESADEESHAGETGDGDNASSLAEDLLSGSNAQSTLAANDPVRIETAAHIRECMQKGTTPAPWVLQMVLPPGATHAGVTQAQADQVRQSNPPDTHA